MKRLLIILILLAGCAYSISPDTTSLDMGESTNGKEKNTKSIKQTFKWSK